MAKYETQYKIGDIVYLKTDEEQSARMVTEIRIRENSFIYELSCGTTSTDHCSIEITSEVNQLLGLGITVDKNNN